MRNRRDFLKLAGVAAAINPLTFPDLLANADPQKERKSRVHFDLGVASYTFRAFTLDQAIEMTKRLGLKKLALKDMHLPLTSTEADFASALTRIHGAGLELSSCGVVYMKNEEEVRGAFAYARAAGIHMMVGAPDPSVLNLAERKVQETDIALAIHNHGPNDERFPSPESAFKLISRMDKRMGLCIDVGHTQRLGLDPSTEVERFFDRLLDIHIKDVSSADEKGSTVEIGRGVIDIPRLLKTLVRLNYGRTLHFEHEKDEKDPLPGLAESVGYVRGVLAAA
jgi:sugar phosphate isomerase/epimerase